MISSKESWAVIYDLLGCGPLESSTVDVPPSIAVTSTPVGVADDLLMIQSYSLKVLIYFVIVLIKVK